MVHFIKIPDSTQERRYNPNRVMINNREVVVLIVRLVGREGKQTKKGGEGVLKYDLRVVILLF